MDPRTIAENVRSVFSLPDIAIQVTELISSGEANNRELEQLILHDPALTAKVLKFANSAYFGFSGKISTVSRATSLIGHKELRNLVIATSVTSTFDDISSDLINMETFWFHSVTCGVVARLFAVHHKNKGQERFFIAGLLHTIGRLVLVSHFPKESNEILRFKDQGERAMINAEREIFGFTHAELGAELLRLWKLPPSIWKIIEFQFEPLKAEEFRDDACVLHVATNFANCIQPCASSDVDFDEIKPAYQTEAWTYLGLDPKISKPIRNESRMQIFDILRVIRPQAAMIY